MDDIVEKLQVAELENKALRYQVQKQAEILNEMAEELSYLQRFRKLVHRSAELVADVDDLKRRVRVASDAG